MMLTALDGGERLIQVAGAVAPRFLHGYAIIMSPPKDAGQFLIPRWEDLLYVLPPGVSRKNFRRTPDQVRLLRVPDVFSALRQAEHICRGYGNDLTAGEKSTLRQAMTMARDLNLTVLGLHRMDSTLEEKRVELNKLTRRFLGLMGEPIDLPKREALEKVQSVGVGRDRLRRLNPSALAARSAAARRRIEEREAAIARIEPHIVARRRRFLSLIHQAKQAMETLDHFLTNLLKKENWRAFALGTKTNLVEAHLSMLAEDVRRIVWNPYRETCLETYRDLCRARADIRERRLVQVWERLTTCSNALRLKQVQVELERLIFRLTWLLNDKVMPSAEMAAELQIGLCDIKNTIVQVDERRFRKPVKANALRYLDIAIFSLYHPETFRRGGPLQYLKATREAMKKASAAL